MMTGAQGTEQVAAWQAQGVSVSNIERELSTLWRPAPDDADGGRGLATRTSVLNLVVYTEGEQEGVRAEEIIAELADSHPSRALIVVAEPQSAESSLDAALSAHCHITPPGASRFCCEQVTITARGEAAHHVAGVVSPLLLPDLPVMVWWRASAPSSARFIQRLLDGADRLILDATTFGAGLAALRHVAAVRALLPPGCALADLSWTRLRPWREALASLFDDAPTKPFIRGVRSFEITYNAAASADGAADMKGTPPSVALFLGWFEASTGLQPTLVARQERSEGLPDGEVLGVALDAAIEDRHFRAVLRRDPAAPATVVENTWLDGTPHVANSHTLPIEDEGMLFARELERFGNDLLYVTALDRAASDAGPLGRLEGQHAER